MAISERAPRGNPGPLRIAFTRAIQDWYYDLIPLAVMNLAWLFMVVTVVAGPPATAAMLCIARDTAAGQGGEPGRFSYTCGGSFGERGAWDSSPCWAQSSW